MYIPRFLVLVDMMTPYFLTCYMDILPSLLLNRTRTAGTTSTMYVSVSTLCCQIDSIQHSACTFWFSIYCSIDSRMLSLEIHGYKFNIYPHSYRSTPWSDSASTLFKPLHNYMIPRVRRSLIQEWHRLSTQCRKLSFEADIRQLCDVLISISIVILDKQRDRRRGIELCAVYR